MATVSKELYERLLLDRPFKLNEEESNYREESDGWDVCSRCVHFFTREVDKFHTCEVVRPLDDSSIDGEFTCDFYTTPDATPTSTISDSQSD